MEPWAGTQWDAGWPGWAYVGAAAALTGGCIVLSQWWLPGAVASGACAAAAVIAGAWAARGTALTRESGGRSQAAALRVRLTSRGRLPFVRDVADPVSVGVHPAVPALLEAADRAPAFVARDCMAELRAALLSGQFALLVGESASGKSRAAFEAVREVLPDRRFVQPWGRDGLNTALDLAMEHPGCVLWADDLERFLGEGGLTGAAVRGLLAAPGQRRHLVATMRAEEHARFVTGSGMAADALRDGRDVLHLAAIVSVPRLWSESELVRTRACRSDPRIADAVAHAAQFGPAEYLAAAPQLLASWRDGWAPSTHPRGAALVMAAVDARRAGMRQPLPVSVLASLHQPYLAARGGALLRPEPLQQALRWATTPLHATSSLLVPGDGDRLLAFDYLVDAIPRDPVPPAAISALISCATPDEAMEIGLAAWYWGRPDEAEAAFRSAEADGHGPFEATYRLVRLIQERDGTAAGLAAAQAALAARTAALGPSHADTLRARHTLLEQEAMALEEPDGRVPPEAQVAGRFSGLQQDAVRLFGADSRIAAEIRQAVVYWTAAAGEPGNAESLALDLVSDCQRVFGEDDDTTFFSREALAESAWRARPRRGGPAPPPAAHHRC